MLWSIHIFVWYKSNNWSVVVRLIKLCQHFVNIFLAIKTYVYIQIPIQHFTKLNSSTSSEEENIKTFSCFGNIEWFLVSDFPFFLSKLDNVDILMFLWKRLPTNFIFQIVCCRWISCSQLIRKTVLEDQRKYFGKLCKNIWSDKGLPRAVT